MRNAQSLSTAAQSVDRDYLKKYKRAQSAPYLDKSQDSSSTTFLTSVELPEYDDSRQAHPDPEEAKRKADQLTVLLAGSASNTKFDSALSQLSLELEKKKQVPAVRKAGARSWHTMPGRKTYLVADKKKLPFDTAYHHLWRPSEEVFDGGTSVTKSSLMSMSSSMSSSSLHTRSTVQKVPRHDCSPAMHGEVVALFPPYIRQHAMLAHVKDRTQTFVRKEPFDTGPNSVEDDA